MEDLEFTKATLKELRNIGISISIDDFGTGYSSLSYLKKLPVDNLKIDISFIRELGRDPDAEAIVSAIITMANALEPEDNCGRGRNRRTMENLKAFEM